MEGRKVSTGEPEGSEIMEIKNIPLSRYIDGLKNNEYFSFVRYGDGEWKCIFMEKGRNGRAQEINPKLHKHMIKSFLNCPRHGIYFGMQRNVLDIKSLAHRIKSYLKYHPSTRWALADVFHYASRAGTLFPLIKQLRSMKVVIVGPEFLRDLSARTFKYHDFIEVPPRNAYGVYDKVVAAVLKSREKLKGNVVYSFSAGPSANIFIQDLFPKMKNSYLIDFGSLWDIFCGRRTRGYMIKARYDSAKLHRNLGLQR